jgi:hypothetical protein
MDERLLDARDGSPLGRTLADLRAPARPAELTGEDAAVTTFHAARLFPRPALARSRAPASRVLTVKLIAVLGVLSLSGLAVAGTTGTIPLPDLVLTPAPTPAKQSGGRPAPPAARPVPTPSPHLSPADTILCRDYRSLPAAEASPALDRPPLRALVERAGGKDHVAAYCARLGAPPAVPSPAEIPATAPTEHDKKPKKDKVTKSPHRDSTGPKATPPGQIRRPDPPPGVAERSSKDGRARVARRRDGHALIAPATALSHRDQPHREMR